MPKVKMWAVIKGKPIFSFLGIKIYRKPTHYYDSNRGPFPLRSFAIRKIVEQFSRKGEKVKQLKIRVIRFRPSQCGGDMVLECSEKSWATLWEFINEATLPESFRVRIDFMDEKKFRALPEHEGW